MTIKPQSPLQALIDSVIKLYSNDQIQEALDTAGALIKDYPNEAILYNISGACYASLGQMDTAVNRYEKALDIKPDYADAHNNLAITLQGLDQLDAAVERYKKALAIKPDYAEAHYNLGDTLHKLGQLDASVRSYEKAIAIKPDYTEAHNNLGNTLKRLGQLDAAVRSYKKALAIKPDYVVPQHMINALTGNTSTKPPKEYVKNLFDDYAERFDDSLVKQLQYKLPFLIKELILKLDPPRNKFERVIDLGCGTGLTGKELRDISNNLTGIDISSNMVNKARELDVYDCLIEGDVVDILSSSKEKYDLFIALDVFIYIGELTKIFKTVRQCCNKNALFIFSIETQEEDGYSLLKSARYSHSEGYILKTASDGFKLIKSQEVNLRKEKEGWIDGKIFIIQAS